MESISEPVLWRYVKFLLPPMLCAIQYLLAGSILFIIVLFDFPGFMIVFYVLLFIASLALTPIWSRTFFDQSYVGCDSPDLVEWCEGRIRFRGSYFDVDVPIQNVISFRVGRAMHTWYLSVKVARYDGGFEQMRLSRTMNDVDRLLSFLESNVPEESSLEETAAA